MADVLDTGPVRPVRRRRWLTVLVSVAVAGTAATLAARSGGDPAPPRPSPSPTPTPVADPGPPPGRSVVTVAVGEHAAYALVGDCDPADPASCTYQLHRWHLDGSGWTALPLRTRRGGGAVPTLSVAGDVVTVVTGAEPALVHTARDGDRDFAVHQVRPGPAVAAIPAGALLGTPFCGTCPDRLAMLEPVTGLVRPLATQPPFPGGTRLRSYDRAGDVVWALASGPRAVATAVSTDAGRSWRAVPVPGLIPRAQSLQVLAGRDGGGYLVAGSYLGGPSNQLAAVWRIDRPDAGWRQLPRPAPRTVASALVGERGLLLAETNGTVWRLQPTGAFGRLPDAGLLRPGVLTTGSGRVLASVSPDEAIARTVLLSYDEGETWRAERVV